VHPGLQLAVEKHGSGEQYVQCPDAAHALTMTTMTMNASLMVM
jgi:hypothetical protein